VTQGQLINFTDKVALALRVAGTDSQTASGALLQLSQALGSGTVRAEEFNSVQEGALPILQAVAAGFKEAGGSVSKLRQLVLE
ncbi:tape measure protein, partial [Aeromonas veronii]|uniref:tape measure protein n=1 Tax=Aeromonas veronii TaxID=654 RepID=UPI00406CE69D